MIEKCYRLLDISSGNSNPKGTKVAANAQFDNEDNQGHLTENGEGGPGMVVTKQDKGMSTARSSQGLNRDQVGQLMALLGRFGISEDHLGGNAKNTAGSSMLADMEASLFTYNIEHGWIIDMVRVNTSHQICPYLVHINQLLTLVISLYQMEKVHKGCI